MLETLGEVLPASARRFGDKTALVSDGRRFSFNELNQLSNRLANSLRGIGVEAGDRVTLYARNSWEWVVSYYAIHKLGAVANPINVMLTPEEVGFVIDDCEAKVLLASREKGEPLLGLRGGGRRAQTEVEAEAIVGMRAPPETEAVAFARSSSSAPAPRPPAERWPSTTSWPRATRTCRPPRCLPTPSRPSATPPAPPGIPRGPCTATATSS